MTTGRSQQGGGSARGGNARGGAGAAAGRARKPGGPGPRDSARTSDLVSRVTADVASWSPKLALVYVGLLMRPIRQTGMMVGRTMRSLAAAERDRRGRAD